MNEESVIRESKWLAGIISINNKYQHQQVSTSTSINSDKRNGKYIKIDKLKTDTSAKRSPRFAQLTQCLHPSCASLNDLNSPIWRADSGRS